MAKDKVSVSFSKKNADIYAFIKSKHNFSGYICDLIRKDIESPTDDFILETKIEKVVERILKDKQLTYNDTTEQPKEDINKPSSQEVDLILSIF